MSIRRRRKVASLLRQDISEILQRELKDPRLGFVSITRVDVSPDMSYARIFVSVFGSEHDQSETMDALESATGFIRHELAPRISLRTIPRLTFVLDNSMEYAEEITRLLNELDIEPEEEQSESEGACD